MLKTKHLLILAIPALIIILKQTIPLQTKYKNSAASSVDSLQIVIG